MARRRRSRRAWLILVVFWLLATAIGIWFEARDMYGDNTSVGNTAPRNILRSTAP